MSGWRHRGKVQLITWYLDQSGNHEGFQTKQTSFSGKVETLIWGNESKSQQLQLFNISCQRLALEEVHVTAFHKGNKINKNLRAVFGKHDRNCEMKSGGMCIKCSGCRGRGHTNWLFKSWVFQPTKCFHRLTTYPRTSKLALVYSEVSDVTRSEATKSLRSNQENLKSFSEGGAALTSCCRWGFIQSASAGSIWNKNTKSMIPFIFCAVAMKWDTSAPSYW